MLVGMSQGLKKGHLTAWKLAPRVSVLRTSVSYMSSVACTYHIGQSMICINVLFVHTNTTRSFCQVSCLLLLLPSTIRSSI